MCLFLTLQDAKAEYNFSVVVICLAIAGISPSLRASEQSINNIINTIADMNGEDRNMMEK